MKIYRSLNKGLTLIEVIVSIAIIGIIAVIFLSVFTTGFTGILTMGRRTQAMNHDAQWYMDRIYEGETIPPTPGVNINIDPNYNGTGLRLVTIIVEYSPSRSVSLKSLVP